MIYEERKHHRKCPSYRVGGTYCECNQIYTPPTIPRYQKQRVKEWNKHCNEMLLKSKKIELPFEEFNKNHNTKR